MNKNILNENGAALIGLLVSVIAIALVFVGSFYFLNSREGENEELLGEGSIEAYKDAQNKIDEINKNTEERNESLSSNSQDDLVTEDIVLSDWHDLKRENEGFEVKYPQGWYYTVNHKEAKERGYDIIVGFEPDDKVWEQDPPFSIELVVSSKDVADDGFSYVKEIEKGEDKKFYIRTGKNGLEANYDTYADKMIESFIFTN